MSGSLRRGTWIFSHLKPASGTHVYSGIKTCRGEDCLKAKGVQWVRFNLNPSTPENSACDATVVTGAGPHAGDKESARNGLSPLQTAQFHADLVFLLVGLTVAMLVLRRTRAVVWLFGIEIAQGAVGFVQYFTHLPIALVALHMLGAAMLSAAVTWVLLESAAD